MNLHLFTDSFFVSDIIEKCENYGEDNYYVVFAPSMKYVDHRKVHHYQTYNEFKNSGFSFEKVSRIFIHYLGGYAVDFILDNKSLAPYYWFFWGADGYALKSVRNDLLLKKTKIYSKGSISFYQRWRLKFIKKFLKFESRKKEALKSIDYCCTWVEGDYRLIQDMGFTQLKFYFFSYLSAKELFNNNLANKELDFGNLRILAGNSLNVTNNHFEIIDFVSEIFDEKTEVVFPVSYSGSKIYKQKIISYAKKHLTNPKFLEEFMSMENYLYLINDCDIIIFFHLRQQAANNSLSLLWMGKILIMHPDSTLFKFFEAQGLSVISMDKIGSIKDLESFNHKFKDRLVANRIILGELFSEEKVAGMYRNLLN